MDRALDIFLLHPSKYVHAPDGSRWHVNLVRGNASSPPPWVFRLFAFGVPRGQGDDSDVLSHPVLILPALSGPPALLRWVTYHLRRRKDWRVVVRPATAILLSDAVIHQAHPDKRSAAVHAVELIGNIGNGELLPGAADGPTGTSTFLR